MVLSRLWELHVIHVCVLLLVKFYAFWEICYNQYFEIYVSIVNKEIEKKGGKKKKTEIAAITDIFHGRL